MHSHRPELKKSRLWPLQEEESYWMQSQRKEVSGRADWLARIGSFKLKNSPTHWPEKSNIYGRRPGWLNKEVLSKPEHKKETFKQQKSRVIQKEYKETVKACSVRKAKAHLEYSVVRDVKGHKKDLYRHINNKRKSRENVGERVTKELVTKDMEKTKVLSAFFTLALNGQIFLQESEAAKTSGKSRARKYCPQWRRIKLGNI
ncbi:mitochondrial enolase superfamily member 1 [Grus japonensis]|uniref:Mitochondrial enolase superfamily member 1 n=1 Tax=Grus japonensis TaxID=30415 RepID=A0ABC9WDS9_GRUJA